MKRRNVLALLCGAPVAAALPAASPAAPAAMVEVGGVAVGRGGGPGNEMAFITISGGRFSRGDVEALIRHLNETRTAGIRLAIGKGAR